VVQETSTGTLYLMTNITDPDTENVFTVSVPAGVTTDLFQVPNVAASYTFSYVPSSAAFKSVGYAMAGVFAGAAPIAAGVFAGMVSPMAVASIVGRAQTAYLVGQMAAVDTMPAGFREAVNNLQFITLDFK
jgi:hypothetical protein